MTSLLTIPSPAVEVMPTDATGGFLAPAPSAGLVFDLGMHRGDDTAFYLAKGFCVVAVEANPALVAAGRRRFADEISAGQLVILNRALWAEDGARLTFHISRANDEWSSLEAFRAEAGGQGREEVEVETVTFPGLCARYGVPRFVKCDIEGADQHFCKQLVHAPARPDFVSIEGISLTWMALLRAASYDRFQIVNQSRIRRSRAPLRLAAEGGAVDWQWGRHASGPFGRDLPADGWIDYDMLIIGMVGFFEQKRRFPETIFDNWMDVHATTARALAAGAG
ncbi:MAG: FkbM family methyltransferase [Paracoccaceae bacterium]